jgi:hypothetical protein
MCVISLGAVAWRDLRSPAETPTRAYPGRELKSGKEIVLLYVGSSSCKPSLEPRFASAIKDLKAVVAKQVRSKGMVFTSIGVALDWSTDGGTAYLAGFGPFNEINVGQNWLNTSVIQWVWRDNPGPGATPMVIIYEREITMKDDAIRITGEKVIKRIVGADDIEAWVPKAHLLSTLLSPQASPPASS